MFSSSLHLNFPTLFVSLSVTSAGNGGLLAVCQWKVSFFHRTHKTIGFFLQLGVRDAHVLRFVPTEKVSIQKKFFQGQTLWMLHCGLILRKLLRLSDNIFSSCMVFLHKLNVEKFIFSSIKTSNLEQEIQERIKQRGKPVERVYYNKGL